MEVLSSPSCGKQWVAVLVTRRNKDPETGGLSPEKERLNLGKLPYLCHPAWAGFQVHKVSQNLKTAEVPVQPAVTHLSLNSRKTLARVLPPAIMDTSMARRKLWCTLMRSYRESRVSAQPGTGRPRWPTHPRGAAGHSPKPVKANITQPEASSRCI